MQKIHTNSWISYLKATSGQKKSLAQMEEREKCKTTSHHWPQCTKWFSRYFISKSGIWVRWTSPFCRLSASFSLKYDVTDAMLQDNKKMKVKYLRSLLFDLFESLHAIRTWQRIFAWFQISLLWQPKSKWLSITEKQKVHCLTLCVQLIFPPTHLEPRRNFRKITKI